MSSSVISVEGLGKRYRVGQGPRPATLKELVQTAGHRFGRRGAQRTTWALQDVSFEVSRGEVVGVVGHNGAGKSTLLSILARITEPTTGSARIRGRVSSLLEVGTGFHPELTGRDNVYLNAAILGMSRRETAAKFDEIVDFADLRDYIDTPVKRYSSGMIVRLGFAVAAHLDPDVLLLDEVLAVGDVPFQQKCLARVDELTHDGRTVLFVSHDPDSVRRLCNRVLFIDAGRIIYSGDVDVALEHYVSTHHAIAIHPADS
jgi:lipopolysaccharide transport system ATP-binding protein